MTRAMTVSPDGLITNVGELDAPVVKCAPPKQSLWIRISRLFAVPVVKQGGGR